MNWTLIAKQLRTVVHFENQTALAQFLVLVAAKADERNHHPDIRVAHCNELMISVYSHDQQQVTERDYALAAEISRLFEQWNKKKSGC